MKYYNEGRWWMPDKEEHLIEMMHNAHRWRKGRLSYQNSKYEKALTYVTNFHGALDIGAHIGCWSYYMAQDFSDLLAFEPVREYRQCWERNVIHRGARVLPIALGEENKHVCISCRTPGSTGDSGVDPKEKKGELLTMVKLDALKINFPVDFVKIDCEGYEYFILQGGEELIRNWMPVIIVEQKPETGGAKRYGIDPLAAVTLLESWGAKVREELSGDYIMSWPKEEGD